MKFKSFIMLFVGLVSINGFAAGNPILTIQEITQSKLSEPEKGLAAMTLGTDPVIVCVSTNEGIGADSERLNIYRLDMGLSVAIWRNYSNLKVAINEQNVTDLSNSYTKNGTQTFTKATEETINVVSLKFGRIIPFVGKLTTVNFFNPESTAELICKLN